MPNCPQCKEPIWGAANQIQINPSGEGNYAVGWCRADVHLTCLPLHVRTCRACRVHNEVLAGFFEPVKT